MPSFPTFQMLFRGFAISGAAVLMAAVISSSPAMSGAPPATSGAPSDAASTAPQETGLWYNDGKRGAVEITQCDDKLCGHIVWLEKPLNDEGKPIWDKFNSDPKKQKRPVCGIQVIGNLARQSDGTWDSGWVYDPKIGSTFSVAANLIDADTLHVRGYLGIKLAGKSLTWTRAPGDLERCSP